MIAADDVLIRAILDEVEPVKARPALRPEFNNSALQEWDDFRSWYRVNRYKLANYWEALGGGPRSDFIEFVNIQFDRECMSVWREDAPARLTMQDPDYAYDAWAQRND